MFEILGHLPCPLISQATQFIQTISDINEILSVSCCCFFLKKNLKKKNTKKKNTNKPQTFLTLSTKEFSLPLIQEGQLSVSGDRIYTSTG